MRHLIVFVKAPAPGRVKTRLQGRYAPEQVAAIYRAFVVDALAHGAQVACERRTVCYAPTGAEAEVRALAGPEWEARPQAEGDLGDRMAGAFAWGFAQGATRAVLTGSDSPSLPPGLMAEAFERLRTRDLVIGPSVDGGYYLIGMSRPLPGVFRGVAWSSARVLEQTLDRAEEAGVRPSLLPPWYDVDTPEGLDFLLAHVRGERMGGGAADAPETIKVMNRLSS
jgi:rSAM/selenodomain-associated transferase 1